MACEQIKSEGNEGDRESPVTYAIWAASMCIDSFRGLTPEQAREALTSVMGRFDESDYLDVHKAVCLDLSIEGSDLSPQAIGVLIATSAARRKSHTGEPDALVDAIQSSS